jgi:hypothetical protein
MSPKPLYRNGPLYAAGPDSEARTIAKLSSARYPMVALRLGSSWYVGVPFSAYPLSETFNRESCGITVNLPGSYCVTHFGLPPSS